RAQVRLDDRLPVPLAARVRLRDADGVVEARPHQLPAPASPALFPAQRLRMLNKDAGDPFDRVITEDLRNKRISGIVVPPEVHGELRAPHPARGTAGGCRRCGYGEEVLHVRNDPAGKRSRVFWCDRQALTRAEKGRGVQHGALARVALDDLLDLEDDPPALLLLLCAQLPRAFD